MIFDCTVVPVRNGLPGSHGQSHKVFEKRVQELCSVNIEHAWESKKHWRIVFQKRVANICQHMFKKTYSRHLLMQRVLADLFVVVCCVVLALCFCRFSFVVCGCFLLLFLVHRSSSLLSLYTVLLVVSVRTNKECYCIVYCYVMLCATVFPTLPLSQQEISPQDLHYPNIGSLQFHCISLLYAAQASTHEFYNSADSHRQINPPQGKVHRERRIALSCYEFVWICGAVFYFFLLGEVIEVEQQTDTNSMRDGSSMLFIVCWKFLIFDVAFYVGHIIYVSC